MTRKILGLCCAIVLTVVAVAAADVPRTAHEAWVQAGSPATPESPAGGASLPGTLWDNGAFDLVNALSSERATVVSGTGGPEGDHGSTVTDDFVLSDPSTLEQARVCFLVGGAVTTAELYILPDLGGTPGLVPVAGGPTTASILSAGFVDNDPRCPAAFNMVGRQFSFNLGGLALPAGHYWLAVVGDGLGDTSTRAFWASSTPADPELEGFFGSTFFAAPYWSDTTPQCGASPCENFAFDLDGSAGGSVLEIPALGRTGALILASALALLAFALLRRFRAAAR